jgi:hydrogenase maturation protease
MEPVKCKTLVLGLGNPILRDDGVGCHVANELEKIVDQHQITVVSASMAGLDILDTMAGYDRVIIIDAIKTGAQAGRIYRMGLSDFAATRHTSSVHDINLATAVYLGRRIGLALPKEFIIFAIEAKDVTSFSEECTPPVKNAIPNCVDMILQVL